MKLNLIDKFIYKLLFLTFILLFVVVLNRYELINLDNIKTIISQNINITKVIKGINGNFNLIDLGSDSINVDKNDYILEKVDDYFIYKQKDNKVISNTLGNVIKINKYNGLYNVTILDENDNYIIYYDLKEINVNLYDIVKINDEIGVCNNLYSDNEYYYYYKLIIDEN